MRVQLGRWIVLLVVVFVALADEDVSKDRAEALESGNNTFVDNVLFQPEMCNATHPCDNGGTCLQNVCSCLNGTSGHLCKTIDDCRSICGNVDCFYNVTSRDIYCKCRDKGYGFDDNKKMCRACDCGSYGRSCSYVNGLKKCTCSGIYEDRLGTCTSCFCNGYSNMNGCYFDDRGSMKCNCLRGFAQLNNECKECDCGSHGNCSLSGWGKFCSCEKGYAEKYGKCQVCDCGENGTCRYSYGDKVCYCDTGFKDYKGTCKECKCGDFTNSCKFDNYGKTVCDCIESYALKSGICTACSCSRGTSCIFKRGFEKECICPHGYANLKGSCIACDCRMENSNCTMDKGLKECHCPEGFESDKNLVLPTCTDTDECLRPQDNDCPPSTNCANTWGSYDCVCRHGFEFINKFGDNDIKRDGCTGIDECSSGSACNDHYARCVNTPDSYRCDCKAGYTVKKDFYSEKYNTCHEDGRPWRTATIVVGCLCGFVIIGLLIAIFHKHCET